MHVNAGGARATPQSPLGRWQGEEAVKGETVERAVGAVEKRASGTTAPRRLLHVLAVDDDVSFWGILVDALPGADLEVVETGEEALRLLRSGMHVDVLVTSLDLPGRYGGLALAHQARALRPTIRVVYTSGYGDRLPDGDFSAGEGRLLHKPLSPVALGAAVRSALADA